METDAALPPALPPSESDADDGDEQEEKEGALPAAPARLTLPPTLPEFRVQSPYIHGRGVRPTS